MTTLCLVFSISTLCKHVNRSQSKEYNTLSKRCTIFTCFDNRIKLLTTPRNRSSTHWRKGLQQINNNNNYNISIKKYLDETSPAINIAPHHRLCYLYHTLRLQGTPKSMFSYFLSSKTSVLDKKIDIRSSARDWLISANFLWRGPFCRINLSSSSCTNLLVASEARLSSLGADNNCSSSSCYITNNEVAVSLPILWWASSNKQLNTSQLTK